jgi:hypothetical protein
MQMLAAGGLPVLADDSRPPDPDNPRGYLEYAPVKHIAKDSSWVASAAGCAVKLVPLLLYDLPADLHYRVLLVRRDLRAVIASQRAMLERRGETDLEPADELAGIFSRHLRAVRTWLDRRPNFAILEVDYDVLVDGGPPGVDLVDRLADFVAPGLDRSKMLRAIDPSLRRQPHPAHTPS